MSIDIYKIIKKPIVTEKSTKLREENKYIFSVDKNANKNDIKLAIEKIFNVDVESVHTSIVKGKLRHYGRYEGYRPDWKKAIIKLAKGQTIKLLDELK